MTSLTLAPHWLKLRGQKKSLAATRSLSSAAERGGLRGGETRRESLRKHRARFEPTTFGFGEPLPSVDPSEIAWIVQRVTPKENGQQRGRRDCFGRDSPPPAFTLARALARRDDTHAHGLGSIHR